MMNFRSFCLMYCFLRRTMAFCPSDSKYKYLYLPATEQKLYCTHCCPVIIIESTNKFENLADNNYNASILFICFLYIDLFYNCNLFCNFNFKNKTRISVCKQTKLRRAIWESSCVGMIVYCYFVRQRCEWFRYGIFIFLKRQNLIYALVMLFRCTSTSSRDTNHFK